MVIEVQVANLGGMHDNGFANILGYSQHPNEKEILVNAFNVFKILSLSETVEKQMVIHTFHLEYGSLKPLQKKVQQSQNLLDAVFFFYENQKELLKARKALEINKHKMTAEGYQKLAKYLPKAQKQLKKRVKELNQWAGLEYTQALKKLSHWEKELIMNSNHQRKQLKDINNYGDLLLQLGHFRRAMVYCIRRVKQVELDRAVEGYRWNNCEFLINKQQVNRRTLYISYLCLNRPKDCFLQCQKLLDSYISTNMDKSGARYYKLLCCLYFTCKELDRVKQSEHFKEKLLKTLQSNQSQDEVQDYYRGKMNIEKKNKQNSINEKSDKKPSLDQNIAKHEQKDRQKIEQKEQQKRKQIKQRKAEIRKIKKKLEEIKWFSFGKYSSKYLSTLWSLVSLLYKWKYWRMVVEEGVEYLSIRKQTPYLELRQSTGQVFIFLLSACNYGSQRESFYYASAELASFIPLTIQNNRELPLVALCMDVCLRKEWWRACRPVIIKLVKCTVTCTLPAQHVNDLMLFGYGLLLLSVTQQTVVRNFLQWMRQLFKQQSCRQTKPLEKILDSAIAMNTPDMVHQRDKDQFNSRWIQYVQKICSRNITGEIVYLSIFNWQDRIAPLIPFQRPCHSFHKNKRFIKMGIENQLMQRQELAMMVEYLEQMRRTRQNFFEPLQTQFYLRHAHIFKRLHLNDWHLQCIPSWFHFYPHRREALALIQMEEIGIDFEECVRNTSLKAEMKKNNLMYVRQRAQEIAWRRTQIRQMSLADSFVKKARKIHARYKHFLRSASLRRLRLSRPYKKNVNITCFSEISKQTTH